MSLPEWIFWASLFLVGYTYALYPALLLLACSLSRHLRKGADPEPGVLREEELPYVSLVVPAHDEEAGLPAKLENLRQLDYPAERLQVVFVSDGSTDGTNRILGEFEASNVHTIVLSDRRGKAGALNEGVAAARNPILVFSDASTLFAPDAIRKLVRHFGDPSVGAVCGALRFQGSSEYESTEGVYWRYETAIRRAEAHFGATLTASGAIYALRRDCWRPLAPNVIIEDFVIPMTARRLGYRVLHDPEAIATDFPASTVAGEFTRRVRIAVGSFRSLGDLLRIPAHLPTWISFVSHKLLRWILPLPTLSLLVASVALADRPFYREVFLAQVLFYLWAAAGFVFQERMGRVRFALLGYYLLAAQAAFLVGFLRYVTGRDQTVWQRVS